MKTGDLKKFLVHLGHDTGKFAGMPGTREHYEFSLVIYAKDLVLAKRAGEFLANKLMIPAWGPAYDVEEIR
jgi:hypothetical protein